MNSQWVLLPLALATWVCIHESGLHATVAGVLLGFAVPVRRRRATAGGAAGPGMAEHFERLIRPVSAGLAVPVFAFFAAGVTFGGYSGLLTALRDPVALGIVVGLVIGKTVGVFGTTRVLATVTRARLDASLRWIDVFGVALLSGIGFTVALLIGDLAYGVESTRNNNVKIAVLIGSITAAALATIVLRIRNSHYKAICAQEAADANDDGIPGVYQRG